MAGISQRLCPVGALFCLVAVTARRKGHLACDARGRSGNGPAGCGLVAPFPSRRRPLGAALRLQRNLYSVLRLRLRPWQAGAWNPSARYGRWPVGRPAAPLFTGKVQSPRCATIRSGAIGLSVIMAGGPFSGVLCPPPLRRASASGAGGGGVRSGRLRFSLPRGVAGGR